MWHCVLGTAHALCTAADLLVTSGISCELQGDNDPVDVVEIGTVQCQQGGIYKVKPLGAYAMIDDGELDWKIVCIRTDDPKADVLNDIEDVERYTTAYVAVHPEINIDL